MVAADSAIRVDFYVLASAEDSMKWSLVCRLLEKAYLGGHHTFVYCNTQEEAHMLDDLLWTYKDSSFIPHALYAQQEECASPIQIGFQLSTEENSDLLLNLNSEIPSLRPNFRRIIEIVSNNTTAKALSRNHYREYSARQYKLYTHQIACS